jgi:hypothetical protein
MIYVININNQIKLFKKQLIKECIKSRINHNKFGERNYLVNSKYNKKLYKILIKHCNKCLNKFTIKDTDFKLWCYFSDKNFNEGNWHNHINTSTINAVIYLKIPNDNLGIDFKFNNEVKNYKPKSGDLLIFPDYLDHYPYPSYDKPRISLNLEIKCNENSREIFKIS